MLLQAALVDGVGETHAEPAGTSSEYSNWRVPLAGPDLKVVHTDEVFDLPRVQSLAAIMNGEEVAFKLTIPLSLQTKFLVLLVEGRNFSYMQGDFSG